MYYILVGAGPTLFVLAPAFRRLTSYNPVDDLAIDTHVEAVLTLLFR